MVKNLKFEKEKSSLRNLFFVFVVFISISSSYCNTIYTVCNGNWNNPNIWQGGIIPVTGDSIYIIHNVQVTTNLNLNYNFLNISANSQICGLYTLNVDAGSFVIIDGVAQLAGVSIYGQMTVNGNLLTNALSVNGLLIINGTVVIGWNIVCTAQSSSTLNQTSCASFTSPSGNYTWSSTGIYSDTIPSASGCDSIITINLTINNSNVTINKSSCNSYTSPSGNYIWTSSGSYIDTIQTTLGCDSVITTNLTINNSSSAMITETACLSYTSPSGSYVWIISGTYFDTIPNASGCDSVITINLIINDNSFNTINETTCASYTSPSGIYIWTSSGTYMDTIPTVSGCDSIFIINLNVNNSSITLSETACISFTSPSGIYNWTSSGTYVDTIQNSSGCDSIIVVDLIIIDENEFGFQIPNVITPNGDGINDKFKISYQGLLLNLDIEIYNRWGTLVFQGKIDDYWGGDLSSGNKASEGVYFYIVKYEIEICGEMVKRILQHTVTVLR